MPNRPNRPNPLRHLNSSWLKITGVLFLSVLFSCKRSSFSAEKIFAENCWEIGDTLFFDYKHNGTAAVDETFGVEVRFNPEYSYRNLHLKLLCKNPDGQPQEFMLNDTLMDADGNWLGEPSEWNFTKGFTVPMTAPGTYRLALIQYMREEKLCDIKQVGVWKLGE
ncbi:MAG: hypothetical protein SF052_19205 [Bacteroidia bacterium]|nr:hypothetical protein [Bacteroidia bacterium]